MKRKIQLTLVLLSSLCLCSACTYDPFSFFNPPSEPTLKTETQETQVIQDCPCEKDKNATSTTPETDYPLGGEIVTKKSEALDLISVDEFVRLIKENGTSYWKDKSIILEGNLDSKFQPELLINGEYFDHPAASLTSLSKDSDAYIVFFISNTVQDYIFKNLKIGEPINLECWNIKDIKMYDTYREGYLIQLSHPDGPNLLKIDKAEN